MTLTVAGGLKTVERKCPVGRKLGYSTAYMLWLSPRSGDQKAAETISPYHCSEFVSTRRKLVALSPTNRYLVHLVKVFLDHTK